MSTATPSASTLITNIGELSTQDYTEGAGASVLKDAAVVFEGERISWIGAAAHAPAADAVVDAGGRAGLPGWVDSHTHLVFAGDRGAEFEARMAGQAYAAGGIAVTTEATRAASDYDLTRLLLARVAEAAAGGTTYLETKTGYGLSVEEERRHARIASSVADQVTFLGAHLVPDGVDADEYTDLVCTDMLTAVRPYVQWADVFCEKGAFTEDQSRRVLAAGREAGLGLRVHGNQLGHGAGVQLAVEFGAASVDHVNHLPDDDIAALEAQIEENQRSQTLCGSDYILLQQLQEDDDGHRDFIGCQVFPDQPQKHPCNVRPSASADNTRVRPLPRAGAGPDR